MYLDTKEEETLFQKNATVRILKKILFSTNENIRNMYQRRDLITEYIREMPLETLKSDEMMLKSSKVKLKEQYLSYWSHAFELSKEMQGRLSEIWDAGILDKERNPDIGRTAIFFQNGQKMTEDGFVEMMLETFRLSQKLKCQSEKL